MARSELMMPSWQQLTPQRRQFVFEQLTRYFLSPLLGLDAITPVQVNYYGQVLQTFDVLLGGEWMRFIPGQVDVALGVTFPLPPEQAQLLASLAVSSKFARRHLSPRRIVSLPPLLVARKAVSIDEEIIGQINLTTQVFRGNHFAYVPYKPTVLHLLEPAVAGVDPAQSPTWPPQLEAGHVRMHLISPHHYQVGIRRDWNAAMLRQKLSGFGFCLPTEDQYEYLMGGGLTQLFGWGNQSLESLPAYLPNRFGLTLPTRARQPELLSESVDKSSGLTASPQGRQWLSFSPFYRQAQGPFGHHSYRKVAVISVD